MNLLTINNMTKSFTDRVLFDKADFAINEGDKVGVIGVNGTGKSTLLKIVAGLETMDEGEIVKANKVKINYLPQNPVFEAGITVYDYVIKKNTTEDNHWVIEGEAKSILNKLGFEDYDILVDNLSGGQKKRVALAAALLSDCEILILDEPTNHLDNEMAAWLEDYLKKMKTCLLMVTHDRYFLDRVSNRIIEIDNAKIYNYGGSYGDFLEQKALREDIEQASERKRQSILRVELEWMHRGARARSTKQKAHIARFEELRDMKAPTAYDELEMSSISQRMGRKTIEINKVSKAYNEKVLIKEFEYIFLSDDRIGIVGSNGCGKSTLMKMIMGIVKPDSGTIEIGQTVKIGYFSQDCEVMDEKLRVIDYIKETADYIKTTDGVITASQMLTRFLFNDTLQYQQIKVLSGGERRRLYLLKVLMDSPNVLILDEPTNDLDIQTMTILEDFLDRFEGIVITVSHDRYFLNRIVDRIFAFEDGYLKQYEGNYSDYLEKRNENSEESKAQKQDKKEDKSDNVKLDRTREREKKLKLSYQEQKDFETIDEDIKELEEKIEKLEADMVEASTDFIKLGEITKEKEEMEKLLEEKMDRWMYLTDLAAQIEEQKRSALL